MVTLASFDGASLVPDTLGILSQGRKFGRQVRSDVLTPDLIQRVQAGDQSAIAELSQLNPVVLKNFLSAQTQQANIETGQREQRIAKAKEMIISARSEAINTISDVKFVLRNGPEGIRNAMAQLVARQKDDPNFDTEQAVELANLATSDPDQAMQRLQDISDGAQAELEVADQILSQTRKRDQVQSSQVLPDGSTVQVMRSGATRVTNPEGQPVTGPARAQAIKTAQEFGIEVQTGRAGGRAAATATEKRASALIERGVAAAESTAPIRRALTLLDRVATGGPAAISLAVKQRLGIEGADEGELSNSLGKAVLSQLRETFGAAFTESEGKRLERIEASFTKSPATNRRLLTQALRIAENTARRAAKAANLRGSDEGKDIADLLEFSLDIDDTPNTGSRFQIEVVQ